MGLETCLQEFGINMQYNEPVSHTPFVSHDIGTVMLLSWRFLVQNSVNCNSNFKIHFWHITLIDEYISEEESNRSIKWTLIHNFYNNNNNNDNDDDGGDDDDDWNVTSMITLSYVSIEYLQLKEQLLLHGIAGI